MSLSSPSSASRAVIAACRTVTDSDRRRAAITQALVRTAERRAGVTYVGFEYPPAADEVPRFGWERPAHPGLERLLSRGRERYAACLRELLAFTDDLLRIDREPTATEPGWIQRPPWMLGLDGASLYGMLRLHDPRRYVEVGSGNSTKFAARARRDASLRTRIASIDPQPRAEIDALCDEVIRAPLERTDLAPFAELAPDDVIFFDGSHRAFMSSDAVVFFVEVLPSLPAGVLVGVHDVFLPHDYPPQWASRRYSEQYLLACYLLAQGSRITPVLPCYYAGLDPELSRILDPLWRQDRMHGVDTRGFTFWLRTGGSEGGDPEAPNPGRRW